MANTNIDSYKHLNDTEAYNLKITINMEEVAKRCCSLNYGAHRLLSAMVHELRLLIDIQNEKWEKDGLPPQRSDLADGIEELLNKGFYY